MPYFAVHAIDRPGLGALRSELRPPHRERLRLHDHPVTVRIGGPLLDEAGAMAGSLLVIEADSRAAVDAYLAGDPYVRGGLFERIEVREFLWGLDQRREAPGG